ncbi:MULTISPECIES: YciI family protein [unclassified Beijerinckia]|uniref:YciI family protein n=1 Tax=unclassified Beijerinckia TaxID=2638183 RepID=UPI00089840B3|nr:MULTISPECIES: YciI family protein [unclassified Beijerinckia]MDH7794018.1 uncharacterized protein YciI [Beijerinckia sp. GAS462]SEB51513.1 hypothetical protein SAMN05443249_0284 [Beijerinckia sp. 28-YEA-48]
MSEKSVPAADIVNECRTRGYLAKQLYAIFTRPTNGIGPIMENLAEHLGYQEYLEREGIMFAAGPHWTDNEQDWEGDGLVIYRASSIEEAREIAAKDPMHTSGARTFQVRPWLVNEGKMTLEIGLATGRFKLI